MKKLIAIILMFFFLLACSKKPTEEFFITMPSGDIIVKVAENEDFIFVLPKNTTYNQVFINGIEVFSNDSDEFVIENISEDIIISFNKQYKINVSEGEGYTLKSSKDLNKLVNANETVDFELIIEKEYDQSEPIVKVNNQKIKLTDNKFTIENFKQDIEVTVENVEKNKPVVVEPNKPAEPSKPLVPSKPSEPNKPSPKDYTKYDNADLSWWYRLPSPLYSNVKAIIEPTTQVLLNQHNAYWNLNTNDKKIVLTMDEGYEYKNNTTKILDIAKSKGVKITFFITGGFIDKNPNLVLRMVNEGHVVANHSDKHLRASPSLNISNETLINDIKQLEVKFKNLTGKNIINLYRPPEGGYSERSLAITNDLGYKTIFWSFAYRDWLTDDQPSEAEALDKIMSQLHPGSILLLHAVSETNVAILGDFIDQAQALGYSFTTIP